MTDEVGYLMLEQLKGLRTDVGGLRADVGGLRAEVGGLRSDVGGLRTDVGELRVEVRGTNERLDHANLRLDTVETTIRDLAAQMLLLGRFVRHVGDKYDGELESIKDRLATVERRLDG